MHLRKLQLLFNYVVYALVIFFCNQVYLVTSPLKVPLHTGNIVLYSSSLGIRVKSQNSRLLFSYYTIGADKGTSERLDHALGTSYIFITTDQLHDPITEGSSRDRTASGNLGGNA